MLQGPLTGKTDPDTASAADLTAMTVTVAANTTAIAGKQDPLDNLAGSGASLVSKPANIRRLAASNGLSVGFSGGDVVMSGATLESAIATNTTQIATHTGQLAGLTNSYNNFQD